MSQVKIDVYTPPILQGFMGSFESQGKVNIRSRCHTAGTEAHRFIFRRNFEQICAILHSLNEVNCTGSVTCSIKEGRFLISGNVRLWFDGSTNVVRHALRLINDYGWQAARISAGSTAEIHAAIVRSVMNKAA